MNGEFRPPAEPRWRRRVRRFFLRHLPLSIAGLAVILALCTVELYFYASSASFENIVRERIVGTLASVTGGRVEIASFHWRLLSLQADARGIVIHGREAANEAPYARIGDLRVGVSVLGFLSPRILLNDLEVDRPSLHLIVYSDGSTNQPRPRRAKKSRLTIDRLFDLKAGHVQVTQGVFEYENRASSFDFQDRFAPLDFSADNLSLRMSYLPSGSAGTYRIETGAANFKLVRSPAKNPPPAVEGRMTATIDLTPSALYLRRMEVTARSNDASGRALVVSGALEDFSHPRWQFKTTGELDMKLLDPVTGYPYTPEGIAHLDLTGSGQGEDFQVDGRVHVDDGAYVGTGVVARGVDLDAKVHADPGRLLITQIAARFPKGGAMEGTVDLSHWLPPPASANRLESGPDAGDPSAGDPSMEAAAPAQHAARGRARRAIPVLEAGSETIPVDGKVTAELKDLPLDTLLDMVSEAPYRRLGLATLLNGPALATWNHGDSRTVTVSTTLALRAPASAPAGEAGASGAVDATYTQHDGSVALRTFDLELPASRLQASGTLGAYPMTSATSLTLDFHTQNLSEFDAVLRSLGLRRDGHGGSAALPVTLAGEGDFHGNWTGSLVRPRLAGSLMATRLGIEMPADDSLPARAQHFVDFDSVQASGSYSAQRISIELAVLRRRTQNSAAELTVSGTLDAATVAPQQAVAPAGHNRPLQSSLDSEPELAFNRDSILRAHVQAANLTANDLQPFLSRTLPVTGILSAQFDVSGPLRAPAETGWAELRGGTVYGEPVTSARAQGSFAGHTLKLASFSAGVAGGTISGAGSYDLASRGIEASISASAIEIARIGWIERHGAAAAGTLAASFTGSGTLDDPHLDGRATVASLTLGGEKLGAVNVTARTAGHTLNYQLTTLFEGAELSVNGQTQLQGDYATQNRLDFSHFDIGALFKLARIDSVSGQSALAGTVTISGPLARPQQLQGEARLETLALTVAGVHLAGEGGVHATLADGRIHLDPVHITGEDTDLHAEGSIALEGPRQLDLAAGGSVNLKLAETLDPDLTASGTTAFEIEARGTVANPRLRGSIEVENGSLSLEDLPNGLSQLHGTLEFNQDRLEVRQLTAMTGGGLLSVGGSLTYQHGVYANLTVSGKNVRIRYPQGVSSLADASLSLVGLRNNLLLSGNVLITRFSTSPDLDLEALAEQANTSAPALAPPDAPSNHVRLDIHLISSPQLNFQNAFAKIAGDVDLRLRGTVASPSVLGRVSITEGSAVIAGTRYELEQGEVSFTNPVRIEPVIDLTATAHVEDYDITLGLHGSPQRLAVTYRSDPPLPESDVVSLLALGHTEDQERLYTQQQEQELSNPATDAILGGALNATVSSRVQKLFGAGSVKVDPDYLGAFGNATSRITVQEQLGRNLTLTYATDVNTTGEQLLQAEVAINRHVSLVVARDESGVFSMVIKATRRYR